MSSSLLNQTDSRALKTQISFPFGSVSRATNHNWATDRFLTFTPNPSSMYSVLFLHVQCHSVNGSSLFGIGSATRFYSAILLPVLYPIRLFCLALFACPTELGYKPRTPQFIGSVFRPFRDDMGIRSSRRDQPE